MTETPLRPTPAQPAAGGEQTRRWLLRTGTAAAAAAGLGVLSATPAEAAARGVRKVRKLVALRWTYDPRTKITKVTKSRQASVTAKFVGAKVHERNSKGRWAQVPYIWSKKKKALIYSRALHLTLLPPEPVPPKPVPPKPVPPKPVPGPTPPAITLAATATAVSSYVSGSMAWHVARRASYGPNPTLMRELTTLGPGAWLEQQLHPDSIDDTAFEAFIARYPHLAEEIWETNAALNEEDDFSRWDAQVNVAGAHVARALWSRKQLLAVMEDFWSNHFNVNVQHDDATPGRANYARMIRGGAFGKFSDLLAGVITHPSMLIYLNNAESDRAHPNENLGRELLELHTVGIAAGYGEDGVLNSARILTGLSVSSDSGEFEYMRWKHWTGRVSVLGFEDPNASKDGKALALRYLDHLAHHTATAHQIARKLAVRFVSDTPPPALVDRLAGVYLSADTAIVPVLRALFGSAEFAAVAGAKVHRPFERLAATVRVLGYGPDDTDRESPWQVWQQASDAGNGPINWEPPNGYPDVATAWTSTAATIGVWNARMALVAQWWPNTMTSTDLHAAIVPTRLPPTYGELVTAVGRRLFGLDLAGKHRDAMLVFLGITRAGVAEPNRKLTVDADGQDDAGVLSWQLERFVSVLLDSPYGARR